MKDGGNKIAVGKIMKIEKEGDYMIVYYRDTYDGE